MFKIQTVTVIGANGTMGTNIAAIFASFGNAKVYMVSRSIEKSSKATEKAFRSVRAEMIKSNLIPADFSMIPQCVSESDLVFECVSENLNTKISVAEQVGPYLKEGAVSCFGTSGLSITMLAEAYPEKVRKNCFGVHFFNPPYNLTLCELTATKYSDKNLKEQLYQYLSKTLFRTVVEVKDSPAFLGNRIGFQLINSALQYALQYKDNGGIDYIDAILGPYTGRSMPPIVTADFVGLDVHKAIVDNLYENTHDYAHDTFILPDYVQNLINNGKLGRKSKGGLYKTEVYENGLKRRTVYDISLGIYRDKMDFVFPFAQNMIKNFKTGDYDAAFNALITNHSAEARICLEFLLKYVLYSLSAAGEVGYNIHSADDVMATGFNWCPPLAVVDALSTVSDFKKLVFERLDNDIKEHIDIERLFDTIEPSKYDYRIYFKAVK